MDKMSQLDQINTVGLAILVVLYVLQGFFATLNAAKKKEGAATLLRQVFGGVTEITSTWTSFGLTLLVPTGISWLAALATISGQDGPESLIYSACISTLIVLITLEFSLLKEPAEKTSDPWRGLLTFALALDILSLLFLAWPVGARANRGHKPDWGSVDGEILLLAAFAFVSSSLVLLFAKKSGEP